MPGYTQVTSFHFVAYQKYVQCTTIAILYPNPYVNYKRNWARKKAEAIGKTRQKAGHIRHDEDIEMEDITQVETQDSEYWDTYDCKEIPLVEDNDEGQEGLIDQFQDQFKKLKAIVRIPSIKQ